MLSDGVIPEHWVWGCLFFVAQPVWGFLGLSRFDDIRVAAVALLVSPFGVLAFALLASPFGVPAFALLASPFGVPAFALASAIC
ncbi:hypothetical protein [Paraburkholderia caribensis]|uniref:hypothetical protein n=1 Tax=Paraburkholderia caribensis TaxID=75105 RepID=UPI0011E036CA|nr:hypothetical protein [Paraburkholderia caribensis]